MKYRSAWSLTGTALVLMAVLFQLSSARVSAASGGDAAQPHGLYGKYMHNPTASPDANDNVVYHGGPVMEGTAHVYVIFWEPQGTSVSANFNSLILRYFGDVGSSPLYHNNRQYKDSTGKYPSGSVLSGSWVDKQTRYAHNPIQGTQIITEIQHAMQVNHWTASLQKVFFVFTSLGINNDSGTAYHAMIGNTIIYATVPGIFGFSGPNNDPADGTIMVASHEQMEAATDPGLGGGAWIAPSGDEIGDKCGGITGNVVWNNHPYVVQKEWDNANSSCVLSGP